MKILISVSYYSPHISGLTNSIKNLAELLSKRDNTVTILTAKHRKNLPSKEFINDVSVIRAPYIFKFHKGFFMPGFILESVSTVKNSDQVIVNLPQFEGFIVAAVAKIFRKKVLTIYACEIDSEKGFFNKLIEWVLHRANIVALSLSDNVISLTTDFSKHSKFLKKVSRKVHTIFPIVLPPVIDPKVQKNIMKKLSARKLYVGFIGRIAAEKGIEYLLEGIPILQKELGLDFEIVLAGPVQAVGEKKYLQKINSLIHKYQSSITQLGELDEKELGAFYALMDVIVLPSINTTEAFGMVQVEAMYCGTPIVVTDLPGVRVPVQLTGMGEIAKRKNSIDLSEKIIKVLKSGQQYVKNPEAIKKIFSTEKVLEQYENILKNL